MSVRLLQRPELPIDRIREVAPIEKGGTGASSIQEAIRNLGAIPSSELGRSILKASPTGKIPVSALPASVSLVNTVWGPTKMVYGTTAQYVITSYDANNQPVVYVDRGSVVREDDTLNVTSPEKPDPTLSVTAPEDGTSFNLIIGDRKIEIALVEPGCETPELIHPTNNDELTQTITLLASPLTANTETYGEWVNGVTGNISIPANASHIEVRGRRGEHGQGRITIAGKPFDIGIKKSRVRIPVVGSQAHLTVAGEHAYLQYRWVYPNVQHTATDWQIASDPQFSTIVYESLNDTVNKTELEVTLPVGSYYARVRFHGLFEPVTP